MGGEAVGREEWEEGRGVGGGGSGVEDGGRGGGGKGWTRQWGEAGDGAA